MPETLLDIRKATKIYGGGFLGKGGQVVALQDFDLTIEEEPALITAIAGESGSGKTTLARLVLGLITASSGEIIYRGHNIADLRSDQWLQYRREVQAIFQDPYEAYNPFYRVSHVLNMIINVFRLASTKREACELIEQALQVVGMRGEDVLDKYPHQLSGGQRQRLMIARAFLLQPRLIVADEPVSMVDASLRAMILDIMLNMREEYGISFLYITHDLSTAYQVADRIYMLYQGTVAETGTARDVIEKPQHPYVKLLIDSIPVPDPDQRWDTEISLPAEEELRRYGTKGCRFYPRCPSRFDRCLTQRPALFEVGTEKQLAACYLYESHNQDGGQ
jgi:peptide/nickel transport system ATP-binding protein